MCGGVVTCMWGTIPYIAIPKLLRVKMNWEDTKNNFKGCLFLHG